MSKINTQYINQLDLEVQNDIQEKVKKALIALELNNDDLKDNLERAMSGRVSDLNELIDISKY